LNFLTDIAGKLRGIFSNGNDELIFFILAFLLFTGGSRDNPIDDREKDDEFSVLFFVIPFILLFLNFNRSETEVL